MNICAGIEIVQLVIELFYFAILYTAGIVNEFWLIVNWFKFSAWQLV